MTIVLDFLDSAKKSSVLLMIVWIMHAKLGITTLQTTELTAAFMFGVLVIKSGFNTLSSWQQLEKMDRIIKQEKYDIDNNREEERKELMEIYKSKGFSGELLDKVVDVLMADDNKLLGIMLQEEFGVSMKAYTHPAKTAFGTMLGVIISFSIIFPSIIYLGHYGLIISSLLIVCLASYLTAKVEKIEELQTVIRNMAVSLLGCAVVYFISTLF